MLKVIVHKLRGDALGARARRGTIFVILQFGTANVLRLVSNLLLTRLLVPEAFGLMALVQVVMSGVGMMSDLGIKTSVTQHKRGDELSFLRTAWTLQVLRSFILAAIVALAAPFAADFYDVPLLRQLLPVAALGIVIEGFVPMRIMLAERNLTIGYYTALNLLSNVASVILTLLLAWYLQSVWALVFGNIANGLLRNVLYRLAVPGPRDGFALERRATRDLIGFGAFVFIGSIATYATNLGDRAILGKFIELDLLGIYSVAVTMGTVPLLLSGALFGQIFFPLYSRRPPQESEGNFHKLRRVRYILTAGIFGITSLFILFGDPLIMFLYDPRYYLAGGITVLVAMGMLPSLITAPYGYILLSNGRSDLNALLTISGAVLRVGAIYLGVVHYGIAGVALAPIVAAILHYPFLVMLLYRFRAWDLRHDLIFAIIASLLTVAGWILNPEAIRTVFDL